MRNTIQTKNKKRAKQFIIGLVLLIGLPFLLLKLGHEYANPADKYRAEGTSSTAHTIVIDDHYHVSTTSSHRSTLAYSKTPGGSFHDEVYSISVDKLNWTDDYILAGAQSKTTGNYSYMILDRATGETEGYANDKKFERGKEEKGIDIEVLDKKYFDWH